MTKTSDLILKNDRKKLEEVFQRIEVLTMQTHPLKPQDIYECVRAGLDIVWNDKKLNPCAGEYNRYFGGKNEPKPKAPR